MGKIENKDKSVSQCHSSVKMLDFKPFILMGIINVTPDSFYDGGKYNSLESAYNHSLKLITEGADILDIGGESSRPGALSVSVSEEIDRVVPIIEKLRNETDIPLSVDTTKASVAKEALSAGATWINDISAGRFDPEMIPLIQKKQCPVILMHSRKKPINMQINPSYNDVVAEVIEELSERIDAFITQGVQKSNIILDPGIGFAKGFEDNIELLRNLHNLVNIGYPVLIGTSRKSFIGQITGNGTNNRLFGTLGSVSWAFLEGAKIFRVHDIKETKECIQVLSTIKEKK